MTEEEIKQLKAKLGVVGEENVGISEEELMGGPMTDEEIKCLLETGK